MHYTHGTSRHSEAEQEGFCGRDRRGDPRSPDHGRDEQIAAKSPALACAAGACAASGRPQALALSLFLAIAGLLAALPTRGAQLTVDFGITYQTIEGLGVCGVPAMYKVRQGPFYVDTPFEPFADTLINEIGITMLRGFDTRSCEFNPSPGQYVITPLLRAELERNVVLQQKAQAAGEVLRFCPNVFSPPGWMKPNGTCDGGGESTYLSDSTNTLLPEHYDEFASLCSTFVRMSLDSFGLPVYALSMQNEPFFNEPYASCSYRDGHHYGQVLAVVGPAVKAASPSTLIYGVEHMAWAYPSWEHRIMGTPSAAPYLDRFAIHGYTDGVRVDTATFDTLPDTHTRPAWLSEFNWGEQTYEEAFSFAKAVLKGLVRSNLSAYLAGGGLWDSDIGTKYPGYFLNAQLFRFIRPGMVHVGTAYDDTSLIAGAFANPAVGSFSVVILNSSSDTVALALAAQNGLLPDSLEIRITSPTQDFEGAGHAAAASPVVLPPTSVVSLGWAVRAREQHVRPGVAAGAAPRRTRSGTTARVFDLRGRLVRAEPGRRTLVFSRTCTPRILYSR